MRMRRELICAAALVLFCTAPLAKAQQPTPDFIVRSKANALTPEEMVKAFEAPTLEVYTLGPGDEITVDVWGRPELSGHHIIGPDGKITIPVSGVIAVTGLSREEAQRTLTAAVSKYYSEPLITVRVDRYTSFRVFILGRVSSPGALQFDLQPTLLDVVTKAGGLPIGGVGADKAGLGRCAVIRRDQMVWIDLKALVSRGNLALNIRLARNDLVYMPDAGDQLVYVLGEVQHPGAFRLTPDMSFLDAFTQAGGLSEDASANKIALISTTSGAEKELRLQDLLAVPGSLNFALSEGDIIYVPKRGMAKIGYILQKLSPISAFAIVGSSVGK